MNTSFTVRQLINAFEKFFSEKKENFSIEVSKIGKKIKEEELKRLLNNLKESKIIIENPNKHFEYTQKFEKDSKFQLPNGQLVKASDIFESLKKELERSSGVKNNKKDITFEQAIKFELPKKDESRVINDSKIYELKQNYEILNKELKKLKEEYKTIDNNLPYENAIDSANLYLQGATLNKDSEKTKLEKQIENIKEQLTNISNELESLEYSNNFKILGEYYYKDNKVGEKIEYKDGKTLINYEIKDFDKNNNSILFKIEEDSVGNFNYEKKINDLTIEKIRRLPDGNTVETQYKNGKMLQGRRYEVENFAAWKNDLYKKNNLLNEIDFKEKNTIKQENDLDVIYYYKGKEVGRQYKDINGNSEGFHKVIENGMESYSKFKEIDGITTEIEIVPIVDDYGKQIGNAKSEEEYDVNLNLRKSKNVDEIIIDNKKYKKVTTKEKNKDVEKEKIEIYTFNEKGEEEEIIVYKDSLGYETYEKKINGKKQEAINKSPNNETEIIKYNTEGKVNNRTNYKTIKTDFIKEKMHNVFPNYKILKDGLNVDAKKVEKENSNSEVLDLKKVETDNDINEIIEKFKDHMVKEINPPALSKLPSVGATRVIRSHKKGNNNIKNIIKKLTRLASTAAVAVVVLANSSIKINAGELKNNEKILSEALQSGNQIKVEQQVDSNKELEKLEIGQTVKVKKGEKFTETATGEGKIAKAGDTYVKEGDVSSINGFALLYDGKTVAVSFDEKDSLKEFLQDHPDAELSVHYKDIGWKEISNSQLDKILKQLNSENAINKGSR